MGNSNTKVDLGFIYCLRHPDTKDIFYIGATEKAPRDRLAGHYQAFAEYLKGQRKSNKRFRYFEAVWPNLVEIELIEIIQNDYLYKKEIDYITQYSKKHKLVNQTKGGFGGDTFSMQSKVDKYRISSLIAKKTSKVTRSDAFRENLREKRRGKNNPMVNSHTMPNCVILSLEEASFLKYITAPYQITEFLNLHYGEGKHKKHAGATGNISKGLKHKPTVTSYGFLFKRWDDCDEELKNIVQKKIENEQVFS